MTKAVGGEHFVEEEGLVRKRLDGRLCKTAGEIVFADDKSSGQLALEHR